MYMGKARFFFQKIPKNLIRPHMEWYSAAMESKAEDKAAPTSPRTSLRKR
jgi:hypothetical protein